jgi:hypothetical protein
VCENKELVIAFLKDPFPHDRYLDDEEFWKTSADGIGVLDVLTTLSNAPVH